MVLSKPTFFLSLKIGGVQPRFTHNSVRTDLQDSLTGSRDIRYATHSTHLPSRPLRFRFGRALCTTPLDLALKESGRVYLPKRGDHPSLPWPFAR